MRTLTILAVIFATTFASRFALAEEAAQAVVAQPAPVVLTPPVSTPAAQSAPLQLTAPQMTPPTAVHHPGRAMKIAGIVLTSLGIAATIGTIAGVAYYMSPSCGGKYGSDACGGGWGTMMSAAIGGSLAVAMLGAGIPLWVVGAAREQQSTAHLSFAPIIGQSSGGGTMMLSGTF